MESLTDFVRSKKAKKFEPKPYYSQNGDALIFYFKDEPSYAERVDDFLTVYKATQSDEIVGCELKGVRHILQRMGNFGVLIQSSAVDMSLLFWGYLGYSTLSQHESRGIRINELGQAIAGSRARVDTAELVA
ncbi:MAG: hypothetical protein ABR589_00290 [Chthoniobacterales bacterium]